MTFSFIDEGNRTIRRKQPVASHSQTLSHNVVSSTPRYEGFELTTLVVIMVIVCKHVLVMNIDYIMISLQSGSNCNATDALIEAGIAHPSAVPDFTPGFQWGSCCSILSFLCCAL